VKTVFLVIALVGLVLTVLAPEKDRLVGRRVFWGGVLIASGSAFFIAYPPDWKSGILASLFVGGSMVLTAYFSTGFITIRGKIHAFHIEDSQLDPSHNGAVPSEHDDPEHDPVADSYGGRVTANKFWWLMVPVIVIWAFPVVAIDKDKPWTAPLMAAVIGAAAVCLGYQDAIWQYPIARGQRLQFVIISIITLGVFSFFYIGSYRAAKHWLVRHQQSGEHRTPRHQKRYL
jgi:hypothetical protein